MGQAIIKRLVNSDRSIEIVRLTPRPPRHLSAKLGNRVVDLYYLKNYNTVFDADCLFSCFGTTVK